MCVRIVQLSDLHQFTDPTRAMLGMNPTASLTAVLNHLRRLTPAPDLILLTGDLAQDEQLTTYSQLANLLTRLSIPTYWLAGNHDLSPDNIATQLTGHHIFADKVIVRDPWRFILLNSQIPNAVPGCLSEDELQFLDRELTAGARQHCFVALHHHPVTIGSAWLDKLHLQNHADFWHIIDKHPQVRAVICGHIHQAFMQKRQHIHLYAAPSTWVQFLPNSQTFAVDTTQQPGFRWYDLYDDGHIHSEVVRATDFVYTPPDDVNKGY